ncbi:MAG: P-II family nitrogen regulator [Acidobacteriota bacterium]
MKEIKAIIKPLMLEKVIRALRYIEELPGITVSEVKGFGKSMKVNYKDKFSDEIIEYDKKIKLEIVVPDELTEVTVRTIEENARTGSKGDGKIFIYEVQDVIKIRTGERGKSAI